MQQLEELKFMARALDGAETITFLERALIACPRLNLVIFVSGNPNNPASKALKAVMMEKRGRQGRVNLL